MAVVLCFLVYFDRYNIVKIPIAFRHKSNLQSLQIMSKTKPPFQTTSWDNYTEADNANSSFAASNKQPTYLPHGIHYIVLYNPPWWIPIEENNDVLATTCAYTNCRLTADRKHLYSQSAIVFTVDEDRSPLPKLPPFSPRKRRPDQAWIFHWVESPVHHTGGRSVPAARCVGIVILGLSRVANIP